MYNGMKEIVVTDEELGDFYSGKLRYDLLPNEYLILKSSDDKILDKYKNENGKIVKVKYKVFESKLLGKIKPKNWRQEVFMDMIESDVPCVCVHGVAGGGEKFYLYCLCFERIRCWKI